MSTKHCKRRGLAPLELVLSLPLLLMVMALMVAYGNAAYWKVRGLTVARHAVWSNRFPRTGQNDPPPRSWPAPATVSVAPAVNVPALDAADVRLPVARGQQVGAIEVDGDLLDPSRGMLKGQAAIQRDGAMLPQVTRFTYDLLHPILEDSFQYTQMAIPANMHRRIPKLYTLPKPDGSLSRNFANQVQNLLGSPLQGPLAVLDQDEELRAFYGSYRDFHPRLQVACSMDVGDVAAHEVRDLYLNIKGSRKPRVNSVPERVTGAFLQMYRAQLQQLQNPSQSHMGRIDRSPREVLLAEAGDFPSLALYEALAMLAEDQPTADAPAIGELQAKIKLLEEFLAKLRSQLDNEDRGLGKRGGSKDTDKPSKPGVSGDKPKPPKPQGKEPPRPRLPARSRDDDGDGRREPKKDGPPAGAQSILVPGGSKTRG